LFIQIRSDATTANFHTDYISIDHYKLLLSSLSDIDEAGKIYFQEGGDGAGGFSGLQDKLFSSA
jgi:hypothetical protein